MLQQGFSQRYFCLPGDLSPEVGNRLRSELLFFGQKLVIKQRTRFERVLRQHTLAEAVNGKNCRFVDLPFGSD